MRRAPIFVVIVLVVVAVTFLAGRSHRTAGKPKAGQPAAKEQRVQQAAVPVTVAAVQPTDLEERVEVTGTLQAADEVAVGARISGHIAWIIGKEGTAVKRGDVVARLDDEDARAQVRAADAALKAAEARLEQAKAAVLQQTTATDAGIQNAQAALDGAIARQKQAKVTADATEATTNAQINAAQAAVDAAQSRLNLLRNGARPQEREQAENAVRLAQATYDNDKANYERYIELYGQKAIAKSLLDNAETKMKISQAQLDSAKQQLSLVQEGPRQEDIQASEAALRQAQEGLSTARAGLKQVDVARANVEIANTGVSQAKAALESALAARQINVMRDKDVLAAQAALQQARESRTMALQALDYTQVYSPVDGVVAEKLADAGQSVGSNATILRLTANQSLYFEANVSELEATRLHSGQTVYISVDALQGNRADFYGKDQPQAIAGTVEKVVPVVDARTRNFTVRVVVPRSTSLFPGMFARGTVVTARHQQVIAVPKDALVEKNGRQMLYIAEHGIARERDVTLGVSNGSFVQILSGLSDGEQIVTVGQQTLLDGDKVTVSAK